VQKAEEGRQAEYEKLELEKECIETNNKLQIAKISNQDAMDEKRKKAQKIADINKGR
jgi:hypothetical protein